MSKAHFEYEESTQAGKLMVGLQEEVKKLEKTIREKDYALEEQKRLKEIEGQIKNIGYDEIRHHQLNRKIEELSNAPQAGGIEANRVEQITNKYSNLRSAQPD